MRSVKSSLTKLIKSVESKFPAGNDILSYEGINRAGIIESLETSYALLDELEKRKETFEVVLLKRTLADLIRKCSTFLNDHFGTIREKERFNNFLSQIAEIKFHIKQCYLLVVEDCIRAEESIIRAERELRTLSALTDAYSNLKSQIESSYEAAKTKAETIDEMEEISRRKSTQIDEYHSTSFEHHESIEAQANSTQTWGDEMDRISKEIYEHNQEHKEILTKANDLNDKLVQTGNTIGFQQKQLKDQLINSQEQQAEIQRIIEDANRASMAGSFRTRKDELDKPIRNSEWLMNSTLAMIAVISAYLLIDSGVGTSEFDYIAFFSRFTVVAPLVWIAWSSARKLGHMVRIREDYAYKYASAMAYEGYRKQAEEVDADLLHRLLELSIENMGTNPIRLFNSKNNHGSPFHEVTDTLTNRIKSGLDRKKKQAAKDVELEGYQSQSDTPES